ncbi:MAG TPA: serine/threonine-protein kinase [Planctomycetota bacterium]|nr:serine/threonine-protein kinase [Planctomycetota bacterium]
MGNPETRLDATDGSIGQKAVELGLITELQLRDVLARLSKTGSASSLASTLVELGLLTKRQLDDLKESTTAIRKKLGKYTLVRQLGRGGMGVVYEAIDADLGRTVALKMLINPHQDDPEEAAREEDRFVREARMSANLPKHPGIVGVYESGVLEGRRYIAMEYIEGCHFGDWCKKSTGSARTQIGIIRDAAIAVDHAHSHGIIHRDLKPANVLIDKQGRPHVTDFGLAKHTRIDSSLTLTGGGKVMGTPAYISPEQASGRKDVDRRTDVWSLGVMLYEILAGRPPFRGETPIDIMMKAVQNAVTPPSTVAKSAGRRAVDRTIENICMKALAKEPKERYPNAKQLATDLSKWLAGETVEITAPRKKSDPVRYSLVVGGVVAVLAIGVLLATSPSADKDWLQKKARAEELVTQAQRHQALGKYTDALVAFGQAAEIDPTNKAAAAGRQETERMLLAKTAPKAAPTPAAPSPAGPGPAPSASPLDRARDFARANPKDLPGQIRMWKEARSAAQGTPAAAEAKHELEAVQARRDQAMAGEFEDVDRTIDALRDAESFGPARDILKQALKRHEDADWQGAIEQRLATLQKAVTSAFSTLRDHAAEARRRDDTRAVDEARSRVTRWKCPELSSELEEALAKIVPQPTPAPAPAPAPADAPALQSLPELPALLGHGAGVSTAAMSPDAQLLASGSFDNTSRLWSVATRSEKAKLVEGSLARSVTFAPDGKWLAIGLMDNTIRIWDTAKLQSRTFSGHSLQVIGLAFSPDSRTLASASPDGSVRLWECASGTQKQQLDGHPKGAMCLAWSPDGKLLAVGTADQEIKLWELPSGRERRTLKEGIRGVTMSVAFSPNGKILASGGDDATVALWTLESGQRRDLAGHAKEVRGVAWSPDGTWVSSASGDGSLRIWEAGTGELRCRFADQGTFFGTFFSRKGDVLAGCSGEGSVRFWDVSGLRPHRNPKD